MIITFGIMIILYDGDNDNYPIHIAKAINNNEIIELLLQSGVDPHVPLYPLSLYDEEIFNLYNN